MKITDGVSTAQCTQNITKKYVRFITPGFLPLCRKCNSSLFFIQTGRKKPPKYQYWTLKHFLLLKQLWVKAAVAVIPQNNFLENADNVTRKQLSPFYKVMSSKFIKKGLQYVFFPTNFAKLLRASFLKHMSR